jgi:uncharacterized protein
MKINNVINQWALNKSFLHGRMSFVCGPRQIGKTTLVRNHLKMARQEANYHNWDSLGFRQKFMSNPLFFIEDLAQPILSYGHLPEEDRKWMAFDGIHKHLKWKDILKGWYDEFRDSIYFIITGSACTGSRFFNNRKRKPLITY